MSSWLWKCKTNWRVCGRLQRLVGASRVKEFVTLICRAFAKVNLFWNSKSGLVGRGNLASLMNILSRSYVVCSMRICTERHIGLRMGHQRSRVDQPTVAGRFFNSMRFISKPAGRLNAVSSKAFRGSSRYTSTKYRAELIQPCAQSTRSKPIAAPYPVLMVSLRRETTLVMKPWRDHYLHARSRAQCLART